MKKEVKKEKNINNPFNNRILYTFILLGIVFALTFGVNAIINPATDAYHSADKINFTGVEINPSKITTDEISTAKLCMNGNCKTTLDTPAIPSYDVKIVGTQSPATRTDDFYSISCPEGYKVIGCFGGYSQASAWNADWYTRAEGDNKCTTYVWNNNPDGFIWVYASCMKDISVTNSGTNNICGDGVVQDRETCERPNSYQKDVACTSLGGDYCGGTAKQYCNKFCNGYDYVASSCTMCRNI